jgi:hypothetical protein
VTQDDLLYRFRPRVFAIAAELRTVRAACRTMGIHPSTYTAGSGSWTATPPRSWRKAPAATCRCRRLNGRRCASQPAEIVEMAEANHVRYWALVFAGAYSGLRMGALAGLRQSPVDSFTAPVGRRAGVPGFRARFGCQRPRHPACRACESTTFATPPWRCGSPPARRPRRSPCAGHNSVSFTPDRYGDQTIPQPVAEGRCHPVRD